MKFRDLLQKEINLITNQSVVVHRLDIFTWCAYILKKLKYYLFKLKEVGISMWNNGLESKD